MSKFSARILFTGQSNINAMSTLFSALCQDLREKREDKLEVHAILLMFSEAVGDSRQGTQHTQYMHDLISSEINVLPSTNQ